MKQQCPHPIISIGRKLLNKNIKPNAFYCLGCGSEVKHG